MRTWHAAFLLLAMGTLAACGDSPVPQLVVRAELPEPGRHVYQTSFCGDCHGSTRQGSALAPPLRDLASHWNETELSAFLRDPAMHRRNSERLQRLGERYPSQMPAQPALPDEEMEQLVLFLLGG